MQQTVCEKHVFCLLNAGQYSHGELCNGFLDTMHCDTGNERCMNCISNDKILDWSKLKASADEKINAINKLKFVLGWVENIVEKGENAGFQHFLLLPQCFPL